jgi:hypothetical protein
MDEIAERMKGVSVVAVAAEDYPEQAVAGIYSDDANIDRPDLASPEIDVLPTGNDSTANYNNDSTVPAESDLNSETDIFEDENRETDRDDDREADIFDDDFETDIREDENREADIPEDENREADTDADEEVDAYDYDVETDTLEDENRDTTNDDKNDSPTEP